MMYQLLVLFAACGSLCLLLSFTVKAILTSRELRAKCPEHVTIPCKGTFEATRAALEKAIPPMDYAYRPHLESGNHQAALEVLKSLPGFNCFTKEPRDFGRLLDTVGEHGQQAVQYQIGNPLTATTMLRHEVGAGLFLPITVLLRADADGTAAFEYVRPRSMMRRFNNSVLYETANRVDRDLLETLSQIAGWDRSNQWEEPDHRHAISMRSSSQR